MTVTEFFDKLNSGATWSAGVSFKRANALPLEKYSVHASLSDAQTYASTNPVAYPGQILAVVENDSTGIYYIDHTMNLKEVGKLPTGDNKTITISDDGIISLYGMDGTFEEAKSYQPIYKNGNLVWVEVSSTTVEGLSAQIEALQNEVDSLTDVVATKANASDVYTKPEIDSKISSVYRYKGSKATYAELPENPEVGDVYNIETADTTNGINAGDNVAWNGTAWDNLGGTVDLSAYATKEELTTTTQPLIEKLQEIENNAEVNVLEVVKVNGTALEVDTTDKSVNIPLSSSTSLGVVKSSDANNKVAVDSAGEMEVNNIDVNKLVQTEGDTLILNGGSAV